MRLIDAHKLLDDIETNKDTVDIVDIVESIITSPTVDAVPVIRCKDCLYWQDNNGGYPHEDCKWRADETPDPDDYCSGAERKEE